MLWIKSGEVAFPPRLHSLLRFINESKLFLIESININYFTEGTFFFLFFADDAIFFLLPSLV